MLFVVVRDRFAKLDARKLALPTFDSPPVGLSWVSSTGIALTFPAGTASVYDVSTGALVWSGSASEIAGASHEHSGPGSTTRSRRSSGVTDTASIASGLVPSTTEDADKARALADALPSFVVWTDTAVFRCVSSSEGPATSCLEYCLSQLDTHGTGSARPRPDLALRACAQALGLATAPLPPNYNPYNEPVVPATVDTDCPIVPESQAPILADLLVQCFAACRALFAPNCACFSSSSACGGGKVSTAHLRGPRSFSSTRYKPRKAPMGTVAGVDIHKFLMVCAMLIA